MMQHVSNCNLVPVASRSCSTKGECLPLGFYGGQVKPLSIQPGLHLFISAAKPAWIHLHTSRWWKLC